jgi:hypothetical protein
MSVIPKTYNFQDHYKGSTFPAIPITFNFDITGSEIICQIRTQPNSPIIHEWKTGANITVVNEIIGSIILNKITEFKPNAGNYVYDLQIKFANGDTETYLKGNSKVIQDITVKTV